MQPEEAIEIENPVARNRDGRPGGVVRGFAVGHHDVEAIDRASLKNRNHDFLPLRRSGTGHLHEDVGKQTARDERQAGRLQKKSSIDHWR